MKNRKFWILLSLLLVFAMALAACGGSTTEEPAEVAEEPAEVAEEPAEAAEEPAEAAEEPAEVVEEPAEEAETEEPTAEMAEVPFAVMPGGFLEQALNGDFAGTTVIVDGPFTNPDDVLFMVPTSLTSRSQVS